MPMAMSLCLISMLPTMPVLMFRLLSNLCGAIFDVIDHDDHGSCFFRLYLVDIDVVDVMMLLSNTR